MSTAPKKELTLFDSTCLIMGIIIGTGIFVFAPTVAKGVGSSGGVFAIWIVGGILSLLGTLCYAELASAYPREGGDYVYLGRAYGPWAGFLFGWIQLVVVRPADIGVMAFGFATYTSKLYDPLRNPDAPGKTDPLTLVTYACGAVLILTAVNILGVRQGKWTQNVLTVVKVVGLLGIVAVALFAPQVEAVPVKFDAMPLGVAMVVTLFIFGGWNEMAYVAAEVKNAERNIVRALVLGVGAVTVVYLLVNGAYLHVLGFGGLATSEAVATDVVSRVFSGTGANLISALVCISALGVINGQVFTGARISYAMGTDHRQFRWLGKWHPWTGTPVTALLAQGAAAVALILVFRSLIDTVVFAAPAVYTFYLGTALAVVVLRFREPEVSRPFRIPGFPLPPLVFAAVCGYLIWSQFNYRPLMGAVCLIVMLWGLTVFSPRKWVLSWAATVIVLALWAVTTPGYGAVLDPFVHPSYLSAGSTLVHYLFVFAAIVAAAVCALWYRAARSPANFNVGKHIAAQPCSCSRRRCRSSRTSRSPRAAYLRAVTRPRG